MGSFTLEQVHRVRAWLGKTLVWLIIMEKRPRGGTSLCVCFPKGKQTLQYVMSDLQTKATVLMVALEQREVYIVAKLETNHDSSFNISITLYYIQKFSILTKPFSKYVLDVLQERVVCRGT